MRGRAADRGRRDFLGCGLVCWVVAATMTLGCSRPTPGQSNLDLDAVSKLPNNEKALITNIYNSALAALTAGNAFKDAWDLNQSWLMKWSDNRPSDAHVIDQGNSYVRTLTDLITQLDPDPNKQAIINLHQGKINFDQNAFNSAWGRLKENLPLAQARTYSSMLKLYSEGKVLQTGALTTNQISLSTLSPHNTYIQAIIRDLNIILAPYATFTTGLEAPTL